MPELKLQLSQVLVTKEKTMAKRYAVMGRTDENKSDHALGHHSSITDAAATIAQDYVAHGSQPQKRYVIDHEDADMMPTEIVARHDGGFDVVIKGLYCTYEIPFQADGTTGSEKSSEK